MIKIRNLNKFFNKRKQNEIHVINEVSLELPKSGMVAIFGNSGCGKTTLLNVIGGLDDFDSGELTINGEKISTSNDKIRNKHFGYIFQNYHLNMKITCYENVANALRLVGMNNEDEIRERVEIALKGVDMDKYMFRTPDTLSGGQQQRIAIARAIVKNPDVILADEPTGNLDEANTYMIMELLSEIAKDRLVLLVTHEANLVDYYCDTMIEVVDGKIKNIRDNDNKKSYFSKDKNTIYLGELNKQDLNSNNVNLEYYGDDIKTPLNIKIVNANGKLFLKVDNQNVLFLDSKTETKLKEGVYQQEEKKKSKTSQIDMTKLPPVEGKRYGRLFGLKSAIISGYKSNFGKRKKGKKLLCSTLVLFSAVLVLMTSILGTSILKIVKAREQYSKNSFYVYVNDMANADKLFTLDKNAAKVNYISSVGIHTEGFKNFSFNTGFFESFNLNNLTNDFSVNSAVLTHPMIKDSRLLAGKTDNLKDNDIVLTSAVADILLSKSAVSYIKDYSDIIGMYSKNSSSYYDKGDTIIGESGKSNQTFRIAAVVKSDDIVVYLSEYAKATSVMQQYSTKVDTADKYNIQIADGETVYYSIYDTDIKENQIISIHGKEIKVSKVFVIGKDMMYGDFLGKYYPEIPSLHSYDDYIAKLMLEKYPTLTPDSAEYYDQLNILYNENYFKYFEESFSKIREYLSFSYLSSPDVIPWAVLNKGDQDALALVYGQYNYEFALGSYYKNKYGVYPQYDKIQTEEFKQIRAEFDNLSQTIYKKYENEFYSNNHSSVDSMFFVSKNDYISIADGFGKTVKEALYQFEIDSMENQLENNHLPKQSSLGIYYILYSTDPATTESYLRQTFGENSETMRVLAPSDVYNSLIESDRTDIKTNLITMAVLFLVMSLCMYFIMRSSVMSRIKEIGIYRAIGVSKKNLIFKFFIETLVLITLTVYIGFILMSYVIGSVSKGAMMETYVYYPLWVAGGLFAVITLIVIICGLLPTITLLKKTPSQILSKYDI